MVLNAVGVVPSVQDPTLVSAIVNGILRKPIKRAAERLLALELEDAAISKRMHRDQARREAIQQAMRELRCSFTAEDGETYRKLRFIKDGRA